MKKTRWDRPSSVDKLPVELQSAIIAQRARGATINEILAAINGMDPESSGQISRSAMARHIKSEALAIQQMKLTNSITAVVAAQMKDQPEDNLSRANMELIKGQVMRLVTATVEDEEGNVVPKEWSPKDIRDFSAATKDIEAAKKLDAEWRAKVREERAQEAARAVDAVATAEGWSPETKKRLWDAVVGVAK